MQVWDTTPAPFESVTAMARYRTCTIAEEQPEGVRCGRVEHNFLRVLGVRVTLGRDFAPEDDVRGAPRVRSSVTGCGSGALAPIREWSDGR